MNNTGWRTCSVLVNPKYCGCCLLYFGCGCSELNNVIIAWTLMVPQLETSSQQQDPLVATSWSWAWVPVEQQQNSQPHPRIWPFFSIIDRHPIAVNRLLLPFHSSSRVTGAYSLLVDVVSQSMASRGERFVYSDWNGVILARKYRTTETNSTISILVTHCDIA